MRKLELQLTFCLRTLFAMLNSTMSVCKNCQAQSFTYVLNLKARKVAIMEYGVTTTRDRLIRDAEKLVKILRDKA